MIKTIVANISCLFIEAARHDYDEEKLNIFLANEHINGERIKKLCNIYINNKQDIQAQLQLTGDNISHMIDVNWHLDHCIKVSPLSLDN